MTELQGMTGPDRTRRVAVTDDVELEVLEWHGRDEGPAFVLLHGLASNARLWNGVAARLAGDGHRVVAVDQRGHGRSSKPDHGYDLTTVTDDARSLVEGLGLERPVVVGQSWGANIVVELAARFPGLASAVGCIDGGTIELADRFPDWETCAEVLRPPPLLGTPFEEIERRIRAGHPDWPESGIAGTLACFEVRDDGTVAPWLTLDRHLAVLRGLWEHRPLERLPVVREPVLMIPAGDGAVDDRVGSLAHVRVEPIVGDHDLHAQHPVRVADLLRTLVRTEETGEAA